MLSVGSILNAKIHKVRIGAFASPDLSPEQLLPQMIQIVSVNLTSFMFNIIKIVNTSAKFLHLNELMFLHFSAEVQRPSCIDVDECSMGICQQRCTNLWGAYRCHCRSGYRLAPDGNSFYKRKQYPRSK